MLPERELDGRLAGRQAFRRQPQATAAPGQLHSQGARGVGFQEQPAVGIGDGNGVVEHRAQNQIKRKLRMQQGSRFQQKIQFAEAAPVRFRAGDVLDTRQQARDRFFTRATGQAKENLVGVLQAESNHVAVQQFAALHLLAVDEEPAALAPILHVVTVRLHDNGRAISRDAAVGKL